MHSRQRHSQFRPSWLPVLGRLALIVSLWHAPLPMLHAHDADLHNTTSVEVFVHHLTDYHPDVALNSQIDFGWHWHLVPPPVNHPVNESGDRNCPYSSDETCATVMAGQSSASTLQVVCTWFVSAWMSDCPAASGSLRFAAANASTQFLDTYLGSVPLGTLLRVARC